MRIMLKGWRPFGAEHDDETVRSWLDQAGDSIKQKFIGGLTGSHGGRQYSHLPNRSSAPGEYPANQSGRLMGSTRKVLTTAEVEVGASVQHARWLMGTRKMAKRKMFDNALKEAPMPTMGHFIKFRR